MAGWRSGEKPHPAVLFWCRSWLQNLLAASCRGFFVYKFTASSYEYRSDENWKRNDLRMEEDFPCFQKSHLDPSSQWLQIDSRQCQDSGFTQIVQLEFYHEQLTSTNLHLCKVESLSTWPCSKHWFPIPAKWHFCNLSPDPSSESTEPCNRGSNQLGPRRLQNPNPCEKWANSAPANAVKATALVGWFDCGHSRRMCIWCRIAAFCSKKMGVLP